MTQQTLQHFDLFHLEETLWLLVDTIGNPGYDFAFEHFFACRRPWQRPRSLTAIGRFGVLTSYPDPYAQLLTDGVQLLHTPEQYLPASELPRWYPLLADLTPRSLWFATPPSVAEIEQHFAWPIFLKGSRQTRKHTAALSIIASPEAYEQVAAIYQSDPVLCRQQMVCREFVPLRPVPAVATDIIPPAFEFRTFWWYGELVGAGPYWSAFATYTWTPREERAALAVARAAAQRLNLPFVVLDVAQTLTGDWSVIECNDAQESGYAGVSPFALWGQIVEREHARMASWNSRE
jgi:hypothetical protein